MIICPASGCRYFIGDQDYDTDQLRCTTMLGSCAFLDIKDASIHLTRQEESVRASTRGLVALYHNDGELRFSLTRLPGIAYGCEAYAGSRVLIIETRGTSAMGGALAGSRPTPCPKLNTDGGLLPPRPGQVVGNTMRHDGQLDGAPTPMPSPQAVNEPIPHDLAKTTSAKPGCVTTFLSLRAGFAAVMPGTDLPASNAPHSPLSAVSRALLLPLGDTTTMTIPLDLAKVTSAKPGCVTTFLSLRVGFAAVVPGTDPPASNAPHSPLCAVSRAMLPLLGMLQL